MIIAYIPLDSIKPNPYQTRFVEPESVRELADDIRTNSLLQIPIGRLVRNDKPVAYQQISQSAVEQALIDGAFVQLAFGHRRLSAFRLLAADPTTAGKFDAMPVNIDDLSDRDIAIKAWNENEQRKAHTPIERARAIKKFMDAFGWTQTEIGDLLHLSRPVISNSLRLLDLPDDIQDAMQGGQLTERQGIALLSLYALPEKLRETAERGWNASAKPSEIVKQALAGASSDYLRTEVDELISLYARVITWPVANECYENGPLSIRCSDCDQHHLSKGRHVCLVATCFDLKLRLWNKQTRSDTAGPVGAQGLRPEQNNPPSTPSPAYVQPPPPRQSDPEEPTESDAIGSVGAQGLRPERPAYPEQDGTPSAPITPTPPQTPDPSADLTWDKSTIVATITWLPADGNPAGRQTMIALRANHGIPVMQLCREAEVPLDGPLADMLLDLKNKFVRPSAGDIQ